MHSLNGWNEAWHRESSLLFPSEYVGITRCSVTEFLLPL
jgi:hypothetical protein